MSESENNFSNKLNKIINSKKTRLCVSLDLVNTAQLLNLADQVGPYVCMVKTHIDILSDFTWDSVVGLKKLAQKHDFLIFEDRKFADIGRTVKHQCAGGIYKIAQWADLINAHVLPGPGIIEGLREACLDSGAKLLLLAQMSSRDNLIDKKYTQACIDLAQKYPDFVVGFISQERLLEDKNVWHLTPGVNLDNTAGKLGQQYRSPRDALVRDRCDVIIVGEGIYGAKDPVLAAKKYQEASWNWMGMNCDIVSPHRGRDRTTGLPVGQRGGLKE